MIQADAINVFANANDFAEPVTYYKKTGKARPIFMVVVREALAILPEDGDTVTPVFQLSGANDIVKGIKEATGKDIGVEYIDNPYESAYQPFTLACMDKARREMGFIPKVGINEGISRMAEEMKKAPSF